MFAVNPNNRYGESIPVVSFCRDVLPRQIDGSTAGISPFGHLPGWKVCPLGAGHLFRLWYPRQNGRWYPSGSGIQKYEPLPRKTAKRSSAAGAAKAADAQYISHGWRKQHTPTGSAQSRRLHRYGSGNRFPLSGPAVPVAKKL